MFRLKLIFWVVALYSCEVIARSPSPEELNWCLDDYPGRHSFEGDKIHGPSVDFMFALADDAGFKLIHSDNTPFERCLRNMRVGQADLMVGLYNKGDRGSYMELLPIYTHLTEKLFYLQSHQPAITDLNQLKGYKIIVRGDHPQHTPDFDFIAKHNNIIPVTPLEHGLAMLMLQHADFVLATDFAASALILRNQRYKKAITKLDLLLATDDSTQIYLGVSRFSNVPESLLKRIKVSVNKMRDSGQIEQILFSPASQ